VGLDNLRIVFANRSGTNDHVRVANVCAIVTLNEFNSHLLQAIRYIGFLRVAAGYTKAQIDEHFRDAGHANAANAYEMNVLNSAKHSF
jgi:hypothetical protein